MTTSDRAYVWVWLPSQPDPVVSGVLRDLRGDGRLWFTYGQSYLARPDAISLYTPELPLVRGSHEPGRLGIAGCVRDSAPDGWGQRVVLHRLTGARGPQADPIGLPELTYLLESGSNRTGAIDFQTSPTSYVPRQCTATLDDLHHAADVVDAGGVLPAELAVPLLHGTSVGGARPKTLVDGPDGHGWIAKFSSSADTYDVIGAEAAAMHLARKAGIDVPDICVVRSLGKKVLLVRRFDRPGDGTRKHVISGLTMLGLSEMGARFGSYPAMLEVLRRMGGGPGVARQLFARVAFNIAVSNNDDHLRNHAALWDGTNLTLTPAFDIAPGPRLAETCSQSIAYGTTDDPLGQRSANFADLLAHAADYRLPVREARGIIDTIIDTITTHWDDAADFAQLSHHDQQTMLGRQFLHRAASYGYDTQ
ncbi:MAG: HipA domain-containing protein [Micrococcales bacterium]|nr:HipA domain-containing protein [Micrococcales bacterium]MCL2667535.1 HipA domain-containing protein [Micrococcales bacterium]